MVHPPGLAVHLIVPPVTLLLVLLVVLTELLIVSIVPLGRGGVLGGAWRNALALLRKGLADGMCADEGREVLLGEALV